METLTAGLLGAVADHPAALALDDGRVALSYSALGEAAARVAAALVAAGLAPGERVGLQVTRSAAASVAVHGVLAARAVAVPLPAGGPPARSAALLADAGATLLLHDEPHRRLVERLAAQREGLLPLALEPLLAGQGAPALPAPPAPAELAYLLYTSGSTGLPKGVAWDHGPAAAFPGWCLERFGLGPGDRVAAVAPLTFDLSTFDLYAALAAGATVLVAPHEALLFPATMARWLAEARPTVMYAVPTLWARLLEQGEAAAAALGSLRAVLFAGEVFPLAQLARLARLVPGATLDNLYGPTETNVCTAFRLPGPPAEDDPPLPIGEPLPGLRAELADQDEEGLGELVIEGEAVMAGYFGALPARPRSPRRYATGDYAERRADGQLLFRGRRDRMVKLRGHRVELGEVEHALARHPAVREAAAVALELGGEPALRAFYVADEDPGPRALRAHLAALLPAYMVPAELVRLDGLPRTSSGKVALTELGARGPR